MWNLSDPQFPYVQVEILTVLNKAALDKAGMTGSHCILVLLNGAIVVIKIRGKEGRGRWDPRGLGSGPSSATSLPSAIGISPVLALVCPCVKWGKFPYL